MGLEWIKFVTNVKLAKRFYTTNYDQLYAYLSQHEGHANEVRITRERYSDPLALVANSPTLYNLSQSPQHSVSPQPFISPLVTQHSQADFPQLDSGLAVPTSQQGEDLIECINKAMAFLSAVTSRAYGETMFSAKKAKECCMTEDLDAYDSDCDDLSSGKAVLMVNLSSYDLDVLSEVPYFDSYLNDMINQDMQEMSYTEQTHMDDYPDNEINYDSNIIPYSQYLQES
nr:hypothetical protein [Tanacetum cinerariifolium]